jgi:hypothetical protein
VLKQPSQETILDCFAKKKPIALVPQVHKVQLVQLVQKVQKVLLVLLVLLVQVLI